MQRGLELEARDDARCDYRPCFGILLDIVVVDADKDLKFLHVMMLSWLGAILKKWVEMFESDTSSCC